MDNIYDTLAKLNKVANRPEAKKIVKEDSNGMMRKGLKNLINKSSKMNKQSTYKPFGKDDPDYETGLSKDSKKDKMFSEDSEEITNTGREEELSNTDRSSVTLDMVAPALKKLHKEYKEKANEYHTAYAEMEADGMSDEEIMNADDDIVGYVNIDDIEDKIRAIQEVFKEGNFGEVDGNSIIAMASSGDTAMRELFMQELKYAIKDNHPDVYSKLFMYGIGESKESDVKRDDRAEKAGREVAHDAKYDHRDHAGKDGDDVVKDIEYDEKHDKDGMHETSGGTLKDAARAGVMARLAELAGLPATEIEEALGDSPEDTASRIMSEVSLDEEDKMPMDAGEDDESVKEEDTNEGNEFSGALEDAKENGKSEFTVDGKKYKVEAIDSDEDAIQEGGGRDMECGHCDGTGKHGDKDCKKCEGTGEAQDDDDPMNNESKEEKVEETTSAGAVADGAGSGSSPYKNASVYESNEIVKRAKQINEDMSFTVSGGPDQEPTLNINASGEEATQLAQLLKLSGLAMTAQQPSYGEVEIQVAEDQEFANSNQNEETADTNTLVNTISGGLNGQKKMAYPRASQGDNAMATLGESELVATSANQLMKQYEAFKTK
jgi:hypothetical protein